jgi:hypothetical protein
MYFLGYANLRTFIWYYNLYKIQIILIFEVNITLFSDLNLLVFIE